MKKIISKLMGGVLLFSLSMSLTSCDDILGEWSRPTPNPVTPSGGGSEGGGSSTINATAIDLDQKMKVLVKGGAALTITATVTPTDATDKTVTWESSDEAVATVENGVVTPVGAGIATITAKSGDVKATCQVFVGNEVNISSLAYEAKNYDIVKGNMGANKLTIPAGFKVALDGVTINGNQIVCSGDATIILADGSTNTVTVSTDGEAGIKIGGTGTTLTINGETASTGILNATGGNDGAGIGTSKNETGGNIVINGGTVTATGGVVAAGIGTGHASHTNECGTITINGGTVTATGGKHGAGIGTGGAVPSSGVTASNECGAITINGGTVTATGGQKAAGIGTGLSTHYSSETVSNKCGAITIGTGVISVTAKKSDSNPGPNSIGKGLSDGGTQTCGTITIGGVVKEQSDFTGDTYTYTPSN